MEPFEWRRLRKELLVTGFISAWLAKHYDDACFHGNYEMLGNPPIEDAEWMAERALQKWDRLNLRTTSSKETEGEDVDRRSAPPAPGDKGG
jgi:hypothetical protein